VIKEEHIRYWLDSAAHDFETAEALFESRKYDWCLFIGHLVLEKTLKALYVKDTENQTPPRIHNLVKIAEKTKLQLNEEQRIFLDEVNDFNIEIRYPDFKLTFQIKCTEEYTKTRFLKIKKYYIWLRSLVK